MVNELQRLVPPRMGRPPAPAAGHTSFPYALLYPTKSYWAKRTDYAMGRLGLLTEVEWELLVTLLKWQGDKWETVNELSMYDDTYKYRSRMIALKLGIPRERFKEWFSYLAGNTLFGNEP